MNKKISLLALKVASATSLCILASKQIESHMAFAAILPALIVGAYLHAFHSLSKLCKTHKNTDSSKV